MKVFQEFMECHSVELFLLPLEDHFAIAQTNGSVIAHALASRVMQQDRVLFLRRHPHQATRSMLLKMDFIGRPQIDFSISYQSQEFFYMSPAVQDRPGQSGGAFCAGESRGT